MFLSWKPWKVPNVETKELYSTGLKRRMPYPKLVSKLKTSITNIDRRIVLAHKKEEIAKYTIR